MRKYIGFFILSCLIVSSFATNVVYGGQKQGDYYVNSYGDNVYRGRQKIDSYQRSNSRNQEIGTIQAIRTTTARSRAQKFTIPLKFPSSFFNRFDLEGSSIIYSNIIPYGQQTFAPYNKISQASSSIRELAQTIVDNVGQQLKQLDSDSYITQCRFKREQDKINFGLISVVKGQKSLQNIIILLPGSLIAQKILQSKQLRNGIPEIRTSSKNNVLNSANSATVVEALEPSAPDSQINIQPQPNMVTQVVSNSVQKSPSPEAKVNIQSQPQIQSATVPNKINQNSATQPQKLIVHNTQSSSVSQKSPTFTISAKTNNLLSSVSGISDPALIPFLTSSYTQLDSKQIENIAKFIITKAKITSDFTIVLINQIKYGIRLVIQLNNDHKLFQALVTSDNKQPQLLLWRRISKISDINPDCFSQYHRIIPDQDLKTLIVKIFSKTEAIRKLKQIIHAEKKITFDGIYYRFTVESNSGNRFLVVFYYIPEKNYDQIVRYELINNDFDSKKQVQVDVLPVGNKQYEASKKYLFDHYSVILNDMFISYLSSSEGKLGKYSRFVFSGLKGKYEAILLNNYKDNTVSIVRWEKLQDGYISIQTDKLLKDDQFKSIRNNVREYIQSKFSLQAEPSYLSIKQIPDSSSFYRLLYLRPFPFVLSVEQRSTDHNLFIRGLQRVQIAPTSQYYNDRFFAGYSVLNIGQLPYDQDYQQFESILEKQAKLKSGDYQVKSVFRMKTPTGLFYKVVYSVWEKEYLASFNYDFVEKVYKLLEFKLYSRQIEEGDYRWKCLSVNSKLSICEKCDESTILTTGRCYKKQPACQLQIASSCYTCLPGFIRSSHICRRSPAETLPKIAPVVASDQPIVTASGTRVITYANGNDQNCLQSQGPICVKCSYRFYVRSGVCKKIQDQCDVYSNQGQCYQCYSGHYLSKGTCIKLQPTCAQANQDGYCTKCYRNYINIQGKCYIKSNLKLSQNSAPPGDQLCIRWKDNKCVQCQFGCFWSTKLNKCSIKDAFCQDWDNQKEQCQICQRGYNKNGGRCLRIN